jgi:hypothetical protein
MASPRHGTEDFGTYSEERTGKRKVLVNEQIKNLTSYFGSSVFSAKYIKSPVRVCSKRASNADVIVLQNGRAFKYTFNHLRFGR